MTSSTGEDLPRLLGSFLKAKPDDESAAFSEVRRCVLRRKGQGCDVEGETLRCLDEKLVDLVKRRPQLERQVQEVVVEFEVQVGRPFRAKRSSEPERLLEELTFDGKGACEHLNQLHKALLELFDLLNKTEKDEGKRNRLRDIRESYQMAWEAAISERDLHFVFGGLVSSGKTTLANAILRCLCDDRSARKWSGEMLPSHALENTTAVTMFRFGKVRGDSISVHIEKVHMTGDEKTSFEAGGYEEVESFASLDQLQKAIPSYSNSLSFEGGLKRLVVDLRENVMMLKDSSLGAEVLVDSPGLDSPGIKSHLVSVLAQKCFQLCFLVDVNAASPFGNHGFEVLRFLREATGLMFPPVIIFTKRKMLEEMSTLTTWKRANPGGLEARMRDLVTVIFDKLEAAGISHKPFFADVDALTACGEEECDEVAEAWSGLQSFVEDLLDLGRSIAAPIGLCRMLRLQNDTTQRIINEIHKEDGLPLLQGQDLQDMTAVCDKLKVSFRENVETYFEGIEWTSFGLAKYTPPSPFNRDTCAINQIPAEFEKVFGAYKEEYKRADDKAETVRCVAEETLMNVQMQIALDLSKYEADALEKFQAELSERIELQNADLGKHLDWGVWECLGRCNGDFM